MKRALKYVAYSLIVVASLVAVCGALTQTAWFRNILRDRIVLEAGERLEADLFIDHLDGNLFGHIELGGVRLVREGDTLLSVSSIAVDFEPRYLLMREIRIDSLVLDSLRLALRRREDGSWNAHGIVTRDSLEAAERREPGNPFPFAIRLDRARLLGGFVSIGSTEPTRPREVRDIDLSFSFHYGDTVLALSIEEFRFRSTEPPIDVERLTLDMMRTSDGLAVRDFVLRVGENELTGDGLYSLHDDVGSHAHLESSPIRVSQLGFMPPDIEIQVRPKLLLDAHLVRDTLSTRITLVEGVEGVEIDATLEGLSRMFDAAAGDRPTYAFRAALSSLDVARWSGDSRLACQVNGTIDCSGSGWTPANAALRISLDFRDSRAFGRRVDRLSGKIHYAAGDLSGRIDCAAPFGGIAANMSVADVLDTPTYEGLVETWGLDLGTLLDRKGLRSNVNLAASVRGSGFDPVSAEGSVLLRMAPSVINELAIDSVFADFGAARDGLEIRVLHAAVEAGTLDVSGTISRSAVHALHFEIALGDLSSLAGVIHADALDGSGTLEGSVDGPFDSLAAHGIFSFRDAVLDSLRIARAAGSFTALRSGSRISGDGAMHARTIDASGLAVDSISVRTSFLLKEEGAATAAIDSIACFAEIGVNDSMAADVEALLTVEPHPTVAIRALRLDIGGEIWSGGGSETFLRIEENGYRIQELSLSTPAGAQGSGQRISVDGVVERDGEHDLRIEVSSLDIAHLARSLGSSIDAAGILSAEAVLAGTSSDPHIEGTMEIRDGALAPASFRLLTTRYDFREGRFSLHGTVTVDGSARLRFDGYVPLELSPGEGRARIIRDGPFALNFETDPIPIAVLLAPNERLKSATGLFNIDAHVSNTLEEPKLSGTCSIRSGAFVDAVAGVDCRRLDLDLGFDSTTITVDTLFAAIAGGTVTASGYVAFDRNILSGNITGARLDLSASDLFLARRRQFEVLLSSDIAFTGDAAETRVDGAVTIKQAKLYLPRLLGKGGTVGSEGVPMLVAAAGMHAADTAAVSAAGAPGIRERIEWSTFFKNLRGAVRVSIPTNTWLRSPEMNLEISGDIDIVKTDRGIELIGPITIRRGQFTLFAKRFGIREGALTFKGGTELNPDVSAAAEYTFRSPDGVKQVLVATISGEARSPSVRFTLNEEEISELDAVSYIALGRSAGYITQSAASGESDDGSMKGSVAAGVAANVLAREISGVLDGSLALDVIDIDPHNSWQNATVTVGKYMSPNLFVSYGRGMGRFEEGEIASEGLTFEYRLSKLLHFELVTGNQRSAGLGLIFKVER